MTDETGLGGRVETRIPWPDGRWGAVLAGAVDNDGRAYLFTSSRTADCTRARETAGTPVPTPRLPAGAGL